METPENRSHSSLIVDLVMLSDVNGASLRENPHKSICMIEGETDLDKGRAGLALDPDGEKTNSAKATLFRSSGRRLNCIVGLLLKKTILTKF